MDATTSSIVVGSKALLAKTLAFMVTPTFGVIALAGIVGLEYMAGKQDEKEMKKKAAA
ncbi:MAG: hypothetical protein LJE65_04370 [Desulfobacteraceae bacterium]|nr:hypothetical protein [Desulfobacteraceae bacterium]